jgi:hypothetical protein
VHRTLAARRFLILEKNWRVWFLLISTVIATDAQADCPQGQEAFTSCQIEGRDKEVFVCFDDHVATYSYGPVGGATELFLSESIENVDFEPWSGLGKAISESVTFYNGDYAYDVGGGFERPFSEEEMQRPIRRFGWIEITESGEQAASLECVPETVSYGFGGGIYDAKVAAGLTWDSYSFTWATDQTTPPILQQYFEDDTYTDCLPRSEFSLSGVNMGDPRDILGKLGSPEATDEVSFSDEPIDRMSLVGAHIDFFQNAVVAMSTTSPIWSMPSGIKVGMTRGEVIRILGRAPHGYPATSRVFTTHACSDIPDAPDEWIVFIDFGQDKRVKSISFATPSQ